jgi:transcriptional antiterminator NusG
MEETLNENRKKWYVVRVATGYEMRVQAAIRDKVALESKADAFGEILIPTEEVLEIRSGKKRKSQRKYFPGYILVEMIMSEDNWYLVRKITNVLGFVGGVKGKPMPITEAEVNKIIDRVNKALSDEPKPSVVYEVGEVVRVIDGPFADFNGVVEEINYEKSRLKVSVLIFGRSTPVDLEFVQVEKSE